MPFVFFHLICTIGIINFFCLNFRKVKGISVRTELIFVQGKTALHNIAWSTLGNCDAVFKPDLFTVWLVNFVGDLNAFLFWTFWLKTDVFNVSLKQCSYCIGTPSVSDRHALQFDMFCLVFDPWACSSVIWYFLLTYYSALKKKLIISVCRLWTWLLLSESDSYWEHTLKW